MDQAIKLSTKATLKDLQKEFERWRATRKRHSRIPEELWESAVKLSSDYTTHQISKALQLNYLALENRILSREHDKSMSGQESDSSFIEIDFGKNISPAACFVAIEKGDGSKMKMYYKGGIGINLMEFGKLFLENEP